MRAIYFLLFLLISTVTYSQKNLVLNPGFETIGSQSKTISSTGYLIDHWYNPIDEKSPRHYYSPNKSVAVASSGKGALALTLGGSKDEKVKPQYITGKLSEPLIKDQVYCISVDILLHRTSKWSSNNVGILLHQDKNLIGNVKNKKHLEASIYLNKGEVITNSKWQTYTVYYIATGGEEYISFGRFGDAQSFNMKELGIETHFQVDAYQSKAYYQIDNFSVIAKTDSLDCGCSDEPLIKDTVETIITSNYRPYLFVLDVSGSMKNDSLYYKLRTSFTEHLKSLPLGTPVSVTTFSSTAQLIFSDRLSDNSPARIDSLLSQVELKGGTNVFTGLKVASTSWNKEDQDEGNIILISDGAFTVSSRIEELVRNEYEQKGRLLTIVHIASKAKGTEKLVPYETSFIHTTPSELKTAIRQTHKEIPNQFDAIACECENMFNDTMNYHFIIDYSGSMKTNKGRAIRALRYLYMKVPETAIVSITSFSDTFSELYTGKKSDMSMTELEMILRSQIVKGGTVPKLGVDRALAIAERMSEGRFSHLIVITDLKPEKLNEMFDMNKNIQEMSKKFDLAVSSVTVDLETSSDVFLSGRTQFDLTTGRFREVSRVKFEKDLFSTTRSSCDFTTQAYHYNPANDIAKKEAKKLMKEILKEMSKNQVNIKL